MRFHSSNALHDFPNCVDLFLRDIRETGATNHHKMHARRRQDVESPLEPSSQKDIGGKQRQTELLVPVFPPVDTPIEREENLEPLA
jgi:hypothetical protein